MSSASPHTPQMHHTPHGGRQAPDLAGLHITADLSGCAPGHPWMTQPAALRTACLAQVAHAGLNAVGDLFHAFSPVTPGQPAGITGMVLLAESHLAVHTWPESGHVTLDVFVCNLLSDNRARAQTLVDALVRGFEPVAVSRQAVSRGLPQAMR